MATTKVSNINQLKLLAGFIDEDDRTIILTNPREGLTTSDIQAVATKAVGVLIGDRYGATFTRFKQAKYVSGVKTVIDFR